MPVVKWIIVACLVIEVAGLGLSMALTLRRELPQLLRAKAQHAQEMDSEFADWQGLVAELRRYPRGAREARLRYVTSLRMSMGERLGMLFGGAERLGVFPVLIALYLQFRNWEWGDWAGAFDVNLIAGLLIWVIVLFYGMGWLLVSLRSRLDSYVRLLEESLQG